MLIVLVVSDPSKFGNKLSMERTIRKAHNRGIDGRRDVGKLDDVPRFV